MILAGNPVSTVTDVPCLIAMGDSDVDSAQGRRLENTLWNYKGILAGYPDTRVAEPQYSETPAGVHIYNKAALSSADYATDNGVWEAYDIGTNARNAYANANQLKYFGYAGITAQAIIDDIGGEVAIIQPSFRGTPISGTVSTLEPGAWNPGTRHIAAEYYIRRAVRDWAAYNPGTRLKIVGVSFRAGVGDASAGRTAAQVKADLDAIYEVVNRAILSSFVIRANEVPEWSIIGLDGNRGAAETVVNTGFTDWVAAGANRSYLSAHLGKLLRKNELTAAQDDPITKGADDVTVNSEGGLDDTHQNFISHQLTGEEWRNAIQAAGLLA